MSIYKQEFHFPLSINDGLLHSVFLNNSSRIRRIVMIAPLVGGSSVQQYYTFRSLLEQDRNVLMAVYDYSGHKHSSKDSIFTIKNSINETKEMIKHLVEAGKNFNVPVHIIGTCYSTIPVLLAMDELKWPSQVCSIVNYSALIDMQAILNVDSFSGYLNEQGFQFNNKESLFDYFKRFPFLDKIENASAFKQAIYNYFVSLFPELKSIISTESFGDLSYSRIELYSSFREFYDFPALAIHPPKAMPAFFAYGSFDMLFNTNDQQSKHSYETKVRDIFSEAVIKEYKIDHYGQGPDHFMAIDEGFDFMTAHE